MVTPTKADIFRIAHNAVPDEYQGKIVCALCYWGCTGRCKSPDECDGFSEFEPEGSEGGDFLDYAAEVLCEVADDVRMRVRTKR